MEKPKVRPVGILKANKAKKAHIYKIIIQECGGYNIPYVTDARSVLLYDPSLSVEDLIASLEVMKQNIFLRREI